MSALMDLLGALPGGRSGSRTRRTTRTTAALGIVIGLLAAMPGRAWAQSEPAPLPAEDEDWGTEDYLQATALVAEGTACVGLIALSLPRGGAQGGARLGARLGRRFGKFFKKVNSAIDSAVLWGENQAAKVVGESVAGVAARAVMCGAVVEGVDHYTDEIIEAVTPE